MHGYCWATCGWLRCRMVYINHRGKNSELNPESFLSKIYCIHCNSTSVVNSVFWNFIFPKLQQVAPKYSIIKLMPVFNNDSRSTPSSPYPNNQLRFSQKCPFSAYFLHHFFNKYTEIIPYPTTPPFYLKSPFFRNLCTTFSLRTKQSSPPT